MNRLILPALLGLMLAVPVQAQMITGDRMTDYDTVFGLPRAQRAKQWTIAQTGSSLTTNILHPGEKISLTFRIGNAGAAPLPAEAILEVIPYGTSVPPGGVWAPTVFRTPGQGVQKVPLALNVPVRGIQTITISPEIPEPFGAYALVLDAGTRGRAFAATVARTIAPDEGAVAFPAYSLDMPRMITPSSMALFRKIGAKASRMEIGPFDPAAPDAEKKWAELDAKFQLMHQNNVTVMLTVGASSDMPQPTGKVRPHLNEQDIQLNTKADYAWLPEADPKFREWIKIVASRWGYPKGPVNAMELWNEPWEGLSISGWGADMPRYREIYRAMANGILDARKEAGVQVLIGGASSSSNTLDKLFPDGTDEFLPILDFASIHYQAMAAAPALIKQFKERKPTPVQTWDTESWIANSEDRVAAVIASMRAMGQERTKGIFGGNVYEATQTRADGKTYDATQAWSIAPAIAAVTKFIGTRRFDGLVFQNGLPWIFAFQGAPDGAEAAAKNPDNGTLVVVGDLSGVYEPGQMLYRGVLGTNQRAKLAEAEKQLAALPATASAAERRKLQQDKLVARLLTGGSLTLSDGGGKFQLFDFVGNKVPSKAGKITVPLDTLGYYLRTDGSPGSFAALRKAVSEARIEGYEPVDIIAQDFTTPIGKSPALRLTLTNILNRPVRGTLNAQVEGLTFDNAKQPVELKPNEKKVVTIQVTGGKESPGNAYPLRAVFDAGGDGKAVREETLRVNVVARKTILVDGKLDDWNGVLPQSIGGQGIATNLTEKAWLPMVRFEDGEAGVASGYMAYDDQNFYFAAKIADSTPDPGTFRFEKRDDDQFYYPPVAYELNAANSLQKKDTVVSSDATEKRALQAAEGNRRALGMYETTTTKSFVADVQIPEGKTQQVAFYFADIDPLQRRAMTVELLDAAGAVLDKHELRSFGDGRYLVYSLTGKVRLKFTTLMGFSAVLNGVFFDATTETSNKFLREDNETGGDWKGKYGSQGYHFAALNQEKLPAGIGLQFPEVLDKTPLKWPEGVRRYSYRVRPTLPFNTGDDVQIAFNAISDDKEPWLPNTPGVPPRWMVYMDTDYEYSLHQVAPQYGGGTEVWRLLVPGMPRKHFYPRQPKWAGKDRWVEGGVPDAKLAMTRDGNTRLVELALPWAEIPDVKAKLDAGEPLKFSFRVADNKGQPYELAQERSVSKVNFAAFHPDFNTHWANEVEFGWEK